MLEPDKNPNPALLVDPPWPLRVLGGKIASRAASTERLANLRVAAEKKRQADGRAHEVLYFHQLDDPYSHLTAQVVSAFAQRYSIRLQPHLIRATGGAAQPEQEKLAVWARRDCGLVAPHFGLTFADTAPVVPDPAAQESALLALAGLSPEEFLSRIATISTDLWAGRRSQPAPSSPQSGRFARRCATPSATRSATRCASSSRSAGCQARARCPTPRARGAPRRARAPSRRRARCSPPPARASTAARRSSASCTRASRRPVT